MLVTAAIQCFWGVQESIKTKHPQLLYESKLYKILQGGSMFSVVMLSVSYSN